jgi:hypothetical protein
MIGHVPLPAGIVVAFAGVLPADLHDNTESALQRELFLERHGWLPCDGRAVPVARYPELFRVIRWFYGKAHDKGRGMFLLPDYRGRFLRGVNGCAMGPDRLPRDPQVAQRQPPSDDLQACQVGSVQDDAFQYHGHPYTHADTISAAKTGDDAAPLIKPLMPATSSAPTQLDANQDPPGAVPVSKLDDTTCRPAEILLTAWPAVRLAPETRVKNIYVHFLISHGRRGVGENDAGA